MLRQPSPVARAARAACDSLEPRRLLATLHVSGTPGNDVIQVYDAYPGGPTVVAKTSPSGATTTASYPAAAYDAVAVYGGDGDDAISVGSSADDAVYLHGDAGHDTVRLGALPGQPSSTGLWAFSVATDVTVTGGAGTDALVLDDTTTPYKTDHVLTATSYDAVTYGASSPPFGGLLYGSAESVRLATGADDVSGVFVTSTSVPVTVTGGSANDAFTLGPHATNPNGGNLDAIDANVAFGGAGGTNVLTVRDRANPVGHDHQLDSGRYDRTGGFPMLTYAGITEIDLFTSNHADVIHLDSTLAATEVHAGGGDDQFVVGRYDATDTAESLDGFSAPVTLRGDAGADEVALLDDDVDGSYDHTLVGAKYNRYGPSPFAGLEFLACERAVLRTSNDAAGDDVWVTSTSAPVDVFTHAGADDVYVGATRRSAGAPTLAPIAHPVRLDGGAGALDAVHLLDGGGAGGTHALAAASYDKDGAFPALAFVGFERAELRTSDAASDVDHVAGTAAGVATTVATGAGAASDAVVVGRAAGAAAGDLDALDGELALADAGAGGTDQLFVDDRANPLGQTHRLTAATYDRSNGFALLTFDGFENLDLDASATGDDEVLVGGTLAATRLAGNGGDDEFTVGSTTSSLSGNLDALDGGVTVDGGAGHDLLRVSDADNLTAGHTHTFAATYHARTGGVADTSFVGTEATLLVGSVQAGETFVFEGTPAHRVYVEPFNHGQTTLVVHATDPAGGVDYAGGFGDDVVTLTDNASPGNARLMFGGAYASLAVGSNKRLAPRDATSTSVIRTGALDVVGTGRLELNRAGVIVEPAAAAAAPAVAAAVRADVVAARAGGTWLGQAGITVADPNDGVAQPANVSVGYAQPAAAGTFMNRPHGPDAVLIRATLDGDLNLDGAVNFGDLGTLTANYNAAQPRWDRGDVDYDGAVDFADLGALTANYGAALPAPQSPSPFSDTSIADDVLS